MTCKKKTINMNLISNEEILLINPPSFIEGTLNTEPIPLGLIFINRYLENHGFSSTIINLSDCKCWEEVYEQFNLISHPRVIGISSYTRQRFSTMELSQWLHSVFPTAIICLGGPHATFLDEAILRNNTEINYIVRGEGEETFLELVQKVFNNIDVSRTQILGISYLDENGHFVRTADRPFLRDLSSLPLPLETLDELGPLSVTDSLKFHFPNSIKHNFKMAPIITSRGCNGICSFCCNRSFWGNNRCTGASYAFEQFKYYYDIGISFFDIYDDNFTSNPEQVFSLCDMLIKSNMNVQWWCSSRVDTVNLALLKKMKQAGCFLISFGVESGSQTILNRINKGVKVSDIIIACTLARKIGLSFRVTISIGHLGETDETISETINLINCLRPNQVAIFILKVYPGTPLDTFLKNENRFSDNYWFDKNNDIVPFFTYEKTKEELLNFRNKIVENIQANIINKYEDESYSIELDLNWEEKKS